MFKVGISLGADIYEGSSDVSSMRQALLLILRMALRTFLQILIRCGRVLSYNCGQKAASLLIKVEITQNTFFLLRAPKVLPVNFAAR